MYNYFMQADEAKAHLKRAIEYRGQGRLTLARSALQRVLEADPWNEKALTELSNWQREEGDVSPIVRHLRSASPYIDRYEIPSSLIEQTIEFGYITWPLTIRRFINGKDVVDIGCGSGVHALGFMLAGANSYTGLDPLISFESTLAKHKRQRKWIEFGWNARQIMEVLPGVQLIAGTFEDVAPNRLFDIAALHYTTEHLHRIADVFASIACHLHPNGQLIFQHHNFYAWNGHHMQPKTISDIKVGDDKQQRYVDWNHLQFVNEFDPAIERKVNKIRIEELRELTKQLFTIEEWRLTPTKPKEGGGRLTEEIRARWSQYGSEELTTQSVFCVARRA